MDVLPREHERVLDGVLGPLGVPQDQVAIAYSRVMAAAASSENAHLEGHPPLPPLFHDLAPRLMFRHRGPARSSHSHPLWAGGEPEVF